MRLKIVLSNKLAYTFIAIGILILVAFGVNALTPGGIGGAPSQDPGHLISTVDPPAGCGANEYLKFTGAVWDCDTPSSGGSYWTQDAGNTLYYIDGKVGIGLTSPNAKLHVIGGTDTGIAGVSTSGFGVFAQSTSSSALYAIGESVLLGAVGIGKTNPQQALDVGSGRIQFDGRIHVTDSSDRFAILTDGSTSAWMEVEGIRVSGTGYQGTRPTAGNIYVAGDVEVGGVITPTGSGNVIIKLG